MSMKQLRILFVALIMSVVFSMNVQASAVKIDSTSVSQSSSISSADQTILNEGKDMLKSITVGGGKMLASGYDIVVGQQRMKAVMYLVVALFSLGAWIGFFILYNRVKKDKPNSAFPAFICLGLAVWFLIVVAVHFTDIFQGLVNPDYAAIQDIIKMFKK